VTHKRGEREPQHEQDQKTRNTEEGEKEESVLPIVRAQCHQLGVAPTVLDVLLERHPAERILQQIKWLPHRNPRDPAAMLVSAVRGNWREPEQHPGEGRETGESSLVRRIGKRWESGLSSVDGNDNGGRACTPVTKLGENGGEYVFPGTELDARDVWSQALEELRLQMTRATFDTWLGGTCVVGVEEGEITVRVRDPYAAEWLAARWCMPIQRTVSGIAGQVVVVQFVGQDEQDLQDALV
jgi:hypothetical protein